MSSSGSSWWHYVSTLIIWDSSVPAMTDDTLVPCGTMASAALTGTELSHTDYILTEHWAPPGDTMCQHWSYGAVQSLTWLLIPWCLVAPWHQQPWQGLNCHIWSHTDYILRTEILTIYCLSTELLLVTLCVNTDHIGQFSPWHDWWYPGALWHHGISSPDRGWTVTHWLYIDWALSSSWWHYVSTLIIRGSSVPDMTADTRVPCGTMASAALTGAELLHMITHWLYIAHWDPDYILTVHWAPPDSLVSLLPGFLGAACWTVPGLGLWFRSDTHTAVMIPLMGEVHAVTAHHGFAVIWLSTWAVGSLGFQFALGTTFQCPRFQLRQDVLSPETEEKWNSVCLVQRVPGHADDKKMPWL